MYLYLVYRFRFFIETRVLDGKYSKSMTFSSSILQVTSKQVSVFSGSKIHASYSHSDCIGYLVTNTVYLYWLHSKIYIDYLVTSIMVTLLVT